MKPSLSGRAARTALVVTAVAVAVSACGESGLLDGLGERSQTVVRPATTTSSTVVVDDDDRPITFVSAAGVDWYNDSIESQWEGEPSFVISKIFQRGASVTRFVQSSRREITFALPGIEFPSLVPADVGWVTSQLVFDTLSGQLDPESAAAFGLWALEPYTVDDGRVSVLRVGFATEADLEDPGIRPEVVDQGLSLLWAEGDYRYELFCRATLSEELCWQMAESSLPLADQLAPGSLSNASAAPASG